MYDNCFVCYNWMKLDDWVLCRIYKKNNAHRPTDHEREDTMENMMMMGSMAVANSINSNSNSNSKSSSNYINTSHDDQGICLQGIMNGNRQGLQVDPGISMVPSAASLAANLPLKRALPSSLCWEGASSSKRVPALQDDDNDYNNSNNSTEVLQQQTLLGAISEGLFRQTYQVPGLNWYS
uniref:NAC domain-containing protein n=1 Tax=Opuntia streptacantha TaxID=393608 RepID=A0A7C8ZEK6_OPUST